MQCRRPGFDPQVRKIPLDKGKATHSSILAWRSPWGHKESDMTEQPSFLMKIKFYKIHFDDNKKRSTVQKKRKLIFSSLPPGTCIEFIQFQIFKAQHLPELIWGIGRREQNHQQQIDLNEGNYINGSNSMPKFQQQLYNVPQLKLH